MFVLGAIVLSSIVLGLFGVTHYRYELVGNLGAPIIVWAVFILLFLDKRRIKARIKACGYMVCVECGYELTGLGNSGRCPECGTPFEEESLRKTWRRCEDSYF